MLLLRIQIHSLHPSLRTLCQKPLAEGLARAKVDQDGKVTLTHHDILRVDVVVGQPERVEVGDGGLQRRLELVPVEFPSLLDVVQKRMGVSIQHKTRDASPVDTDPVVLGEMRVWVRGQLLEDERLGQQDPAEETAIVLVVEFLVGKDFVHGHVGTFHEEGLTIAWWGRDGQAGIGAQAGKDVAVGNRCECIPKVLQRGCVPGLLELAKEGVVIAREEVVGEVLEGACCRVAGFNHGVEVLERLDGRKRRGCGCLGLDGGAHDGSR